jgi:hypothetical protein
MQDPVALLWRMPKDQEETQAEESESVEKLNDDGTPLTPEQEAQQALDGDADEPEPEEDDPDDE